MPWAAKYSAAESKNPAQVVGLARRRDLGVGEPAVVVDDGVDVVVADRGRLRPLVGAHLAAVGAPAAAVGDPADLLDVHVDQLAGPFTLVADGGRLRGADHLTGQRIELAQPRHVVAAQDPADTVRAGTPSSRAEPVLTPAVLEPGGDDPASTSALVRVGIECGREIGRPARRRPRRRSGRPSGERTGVRSPSPWRRERPASLLADALHEQPSAMNVRRALR